MRVNQYWRLIQKLVLAIKTTSPELQVSNRIRKEIQWSIPCRNSPSLRSHPRHRHEGRTILKWDILHRCSARSRIYSEDIRNYLQNFRSSPFVLNIWKFFTQCISVFGRSVSFLSRPGTNIFQRPGSKLGLLHLAIHLNRL